MLRDAGASWVILGHSERRQNHGETDELVREKALAAVEAGLMPIVCVGETSDQRSGGQETEVVGWQLAAACPSRSQASWPTSRSGQSAPAGPRPRPTWRRCTFHPARNCCASSATPGSAIRILYGGSVKADNAAALLAVPNVGGALVGGASLKADEFLAIARAAQAE